MASSKFGKLRMKDPADLMPGSRKKISWICDCGKETLAQPLGVTRGHTSSCGRCNELPASHFGSTSYGRLKMEPPAASMPGSKKPVRWSCSCGRHIDRPVYLVTSGHTSSCGRCRQDDPGYWASESYGRLTMDPLVRLSSGSNKTVRWSCSCGGTTDQQVYTVTAGNVVSCGNRMAKARDWHAASRQALRDLRTPASPESFPPGLLTPLEAITGVEKPFLARCGICGSSYRPRLSNLRRGSSITCGCASNMTSGAAVEVAEFVRSLGVDAVLEHVVSGLSYDVFVPSANLLVEYNGLRWHSMAGSQRRDSAKYEAALAAGHSYLMLFEDEWEGSRAKVEALLRNRLARSSPASVRPSECVLRRASPAECSPFYDLHHYIGRCGAKVHYGAFLRGELVACASFSTPTRQSGHPWELLRMASRPDVRVHGVWSELLSLFVAEHSPASVVSFSDNRLFPGGVYGRLGFVRDGSVRPDYFWVRGARRHHKSGLRKRGAERASGLTEGELREAQGYRRIWDLGKTRWVWRPSASP